MINKNKKIKTILLITIILSLIITIPLNTRTVFAEDGKSKTTQEVHQDCSILPPINVKDSIVLSIASLCIPGILEKGNEYRQIKCQKIICKYNAVINSISPSYCSKQEAYRTCKYTLGEITAIPPLNLFDQLREGIADIWSNLPAATYGIGIAILRENSKDCLTGGPAACSSEQIGPAQIILGLNDMAAGVKTFMDIIDYGFFPDFNTDDYCDQIEDIKTELELVIAGTTTSTTQENNNTATNSS